MLRKIKKIFYITDKNCKFMKGGDALLYPVDNQ